MCTGYVLDIYKSDNLRTFKTFLILNRLNSQILSKKEANIAKIADLLDQLFSHNRSTVFTSFICGIDLSKHSGVPRFRYDYFGVTS